MNIYFFSHHTPDPEMVQDLGAPITAQFKSPISDIHRIGDRLIFTETLFIGGQTIKTSHTIPAESIVVVEGPLTIQEAWLKAGIATLLVPQINQLDSWGRISFKYDGLLQIHQIEVVTSHWTGTKSERTEKAEAQAFPILN